MIAADWGYAIPAVMVAIGAAGWLGGEAIEWARDQWMASKARHADREGARTWGRVGVVVRGAGGADDREASGQLDQPVAPAGQLVANPPTSRPFDWALHDPWLADGPEPAPSLAGGDVVEAAEFIVAREAQRITRGVTG